jgi:hypothetical protein
LSNFVIFLEKITIIFDEFTLFQSTKNQGLNPAELILSEESIAIVANKFQACVFLSAIASFCIGTPKADAALLIGNSVGFDFTNNNFGAILRYDGITGDPLPSSGNSGAIFVPTNDKLDRPIGITYFKSVPEPSLVAGLIAIGTLVTGKQLKQKKQG